MASKVFRATLRATALFGTICATCQAGSSVNIMTITFTMRAAQLSASPPSATLSYSEARACRIQLHTYLEPETHCDSDAHFNASSLKSGSATMEGCFTSSGQLLYHSAMAGSIGPDSSSYEDFCSMKSVNGMIADDAYAPACLNMLMTPVDGALVFSSFPTSVSFIPGVEITVWTAMSIDDARTGDTIGTFRSRIALIYGEGTVAVFQRTGTSVKAPSGWDAGSNSIYEFAPGWVSGTATFSGPSFVKGPTGGGYSTTMSVVQANENALDLNGDGRFDENDVTWLEGEIPSTDPDLMGRVNLDNTGTSEDVVDEDDVASLITLLGYGLGTPKFGDRDGDGCVACADAIHGPVDVDALFDDVIPGDPLYNISLDANADGIQDASDRMAFYAAVNHSDFNNDGIVDDDDFLIFDDFYNEFNTAEGDQNGDGLTDDADFVIFMVRYNEYFCPTCS